MCKSIIKPRYLKLDGSGYKLRDLHVFKIFNVFEILKFNCILQTNGIRLKVSKVNRKTNGYINKPINKN